MKKLTVREKAARIHMQLLALYAQAHTEKNEAAKAKINKALHAVDEVIANA